MGTESRANPFNRWKANAHPSVSETFDRHGHPLQAGDIVYLIGKQDVMWRVVHVKPVLDAQAPAGLVEVAFQAVFIPRVPGGQPVMDVIKVRDASEFVVPPTAEETVDPLRRAVSEEPPNQ